MPYIPATRQRTLKRPQEDLIQWAIIEPRYKKPSLAYDDSTQSITTLDIAKRFILLLRGNSNQKTDLIQTIVHDISVLYQEVSFSTRTFNMYVVDNVTHFPKLLENYYLVSSLLDNKLALSLDSILPCIPNLDHCLCELLSVEEEIGEAYIASMQEDMLKEILDKDGRQFVYWNGTIKSDNARRFLYVLKHYSQRMNVDQRQSLLVHLLSFEKISPKPTDETLNNCYYRLLKRIKEILLIPANKMSTKQYDSHITKLPVYQLISTWFFEFNPHSNVRLSDLLLHVINLNALTTASDNKRELLDISLLLYVYHTACKQLTVDGRDVVRISDIIETLNEAAIHSLERDDSGELAVIVTLAQFALEHMHATVGYTYAHWFDATFINPKTSVLTKRTALTFIKILQQMLPYELASVLQIHGKALVQCSTIPNASVYATAARKRLLELGVDHTFKSYPNSLKSANQLENIVIAQDEIADILQKFIDKGGVIPGSLLQAHVFRRSWFLSTFLPKLLSWKGNQMDARDQLVQALKDINKIPDTMYNDFLQNKKGK